MTLLSKNQRAFLLLIFSSILITNLFAQPTDDRLKGLDAEMENVLSAFKAPGFSVAVVEKDKVIYAKGFGYRDYENKISADENTLFAIGSSTKAFTCSLLGVLRQEGAIDFDDSPRKYLPELSFYNDEMNNQITVKDMMCHRTGLPRHDFSWYLFPSTSKDSLLMRIKYQEPTAKVREIWQYNNFMFMTQGLIAERLANKSWDQLIKEKFFSPLQMTRSNTTIPELQKSTNAAFGYDLVKDSLIKKTDYYKIRAMGPAGSINSSAKDMANWMITWTNGGEFKGKEVIPASYFSEAISPQMLMPGGSPGTEFPDLHFATYGYGWMQSSYRGHYRVQHGGNIDGFSANACFFPSDSIGIVVLTNQSGSAVPSAVRNIIADRMLGLSDLEWRKVLRGRIEKAIAGQKETESNKVSTQQAGTALSHDFTAFTGLFHHDGYGTMEVFSKDDSLFLKVPDLKIFLDHYHYNVFKPYLIKNGRIDTDNDLELFFNFQTNDLGEISSVTFPAQGGIDPLIFKRKPKVTDIDKSELEQYVGLYSLGTVDAKFFIKNDQTLFCFIPGQPEYKLASTGKHKFTLSALSGYNIEFVENNGKIKEVKFIQPNGTFTAVRK